MVDSDDWRRLREDYNGVYSGWHSPSLNIFLVFQKQGRKSANKKDK